MIRRIKNKYLRRTLLVLVLPFGVLLGALIACGAALKEVAEEIPGTCANVWHGEKYGYGE
jgi:hypothetical protein